MTHFSLPYPDHAIRDRAAHVLVGCTAVGKTSVAQYLAEQDGMDILSADSMLVYRGMDIGTAKPTEAERGSVVYRGIDLVEPAADFSTGRFLESATQAFREAERMQVVVGGTGLYVKGLIEGLDASGPPDAELRAVVRALFEADGLDGVQAKLRAEFPQWWERLEDPQNPRRVCRALEQAMSGTPPFEDGSRSSAKIVGLSLPPEALQERIELRVKAMYEGGLLEEVEGLMARAGGFSVTAAGAIGYAEAMGVLSGNVSREDAMTQTVVRTRRLAKRQRTWFRHQANVEWIEVEDREVDQIAAAVRDVWKRTGPTPIGNVHE